MRWLLVVLLGVVALVGAGRLLLPRLWSTPAPSAIDVAAEPEQVAIEPPETVQVERGGRTFTIQKLYRYEVVGEVMSATSYDVTWTNDFFDVDVGLLWGPHREDFKKRFKFFQMGRFLFWRTDEQVPADLQAELTQHIANNHLIPAEGIPHLATMIRWIRSGQHVRIKGALVRIVGPGGEVMATSSTSRSDTGAGACEIIWVDELQVDDRVFH